MYFCIIVVIIFVDLFIIVIIMQWTAFWRENDCTEVPASFKRLSFFSVAVITHRDPEQLLEERVYLGLEFVVG